MKIKEFGNLELLKLHSMILSEIRRRHITRSNNNVISDYGELVACKLLKLRRMNKSTRGYDATDNQDKKYQIKSRRDISNKKSRQVGVIRNLNENPFNFLVVVIFNEDFNVKSVWKIPLEVVKRYSKFSSHQNGYIFTLKDDVIFNPSVVRVK